MRQANTASRIVVWGASVTIAIILATWLAGTMQPLRQQTVSVNDDLTKLQSLYSHACTSEAFNASYNPRTESGDLLLNATSVCINATTHRCTVLPCESEATAIDLSNRTTIRIATANDSITIT